MMVLGGNMALTGFRKAAAILRNFLRIHHQPIAIFLGNPSDSSPQMVPVLWSTDSPAIA